MKKTFRFKGWNLVLDPSEKYEGGTPALVWSPFYRESGTFTRALEEGTVGDDYPIPERILTWLSGLEYAVEAFIVEAESVN